MAEFRQQSSDKEKGRAHRAAPLPSSLRFVAANDNRPPRNPRTKWLALTLAAAATLVLWLKTRLG